MADKKTGELENEPMLKCKDNNFFKVEIQTIETVAGQLHLIVEDDYSTLRHKIDCNIEYNTNDDRYREKVNHYKEQI